MPMWAEVWVSQPTSNPLVPPNRVLGVGKTVPSEVLSAQGLGSLAPFYTGLWLARHEGMDPDSNPFLAHYTSFHILFHSFIPS